MVYRLSVILYLKQPANHSNQPNCLNPTPYLLCSKFELDSIAHTGEEKTFQFLVWQPDKNAQYWANLTNLYRLTAKEEKALAAGYLSLPIF
jgi:hypothetical protein